jgi:hypothetical protein
MILKLLKSNQAYHFFTIPLLVAGLWFRSYTHPEYFPFFEGEDQMFLFQLVNGLLGQSALLNNLLAMVFVVGLSFLVLRLNTNFAFIRARTFLPSNIFILIISGMLSLHTFHPVYFGLLFLMLSVERIFISYDIEKFHGGAFESGFFIGVGSLFYLNLIFFFPIIWIGLLLIRKRPEWRNYVLPVLGVFVPWLFAWSYYFLDGQQEAFIEIISVNFVTENNLLRENIPLQVYLGFLTALTLLGSIFLLGQYDEKKISTRKYFQVFFLIFAIAFVLLIVVPAVSQEILVLMALPLTFLISNFLIYMKRQFWSNLIMYLFIAMVIYLQFA